MGLWFSSRKSGLDTNVRPEDGTQNEPSAVVQQQPTVAKLFKFKVIPGIPSGYEPSEAEMAKQACPVVPEAVMKPSIEAALGYKFQSKGLLVEALSHASLPSEGIPCYERLEFLGDSVLGYLIARYLFLRYQEQPPGMLTELRAATVNNENFARISVKHNLHRHLLHSSSDLEAQIQDFVENIQGELDQPGLNSFGIGELEAPKRAPKVLADVLESIAGAIFLDTRLNADKVWQVFEPLLQPMVTPETLRMQPVRELQERCQQRAEFLEYKDLDSGGGSTVTVVFIDGVQISTGQSTQKEMARKLAARNALEVLKEKDSNVSKGKEAKEEAGWKNDFTIQKLNDICRRRKWSMPEYRLLRVSGPAHAKRFSFTVGVDRSQLGWTECEGQPMPSRRMARLSAALVLLDLLKASGLE